MSIIFRKNLLWRYQSHQAYSSSRMGVKSSRQVVEKNHKIQVQRKINIWMKTCKKNRSANATSQVYNKKMTYNGISVLIITGGVSRTSTRLAESRSSLSPHTCLHAAYVEPAPDSIGIWRNNRSKINLGSWRQYVFPQRSAMKDNHAGRRRSSRFSFTFQLIEKPVDSTQATEFKCI